MVSLTTLFKGKVVLLGIGNTLKQDDGAGPAVVKSVESSKVTAIDAGSAPENFTGQIKQLQPDTLVIVDAIDFRGKPGEIRVIEENELSGAEFTTHNASIKTFIRFLKDDLPSLNVVIVGIQPKIVAFGEGLSPEVRKGVEEICTNFI